MDISVARHVDEGVGKELWAPYLHNVFFLADVGPEVIVAKPDEVRKGGFIGIPVASASVFELSYPYRRRLAVYRRDGHGQVKNHRNDQPGFAHSCMLSGFRLF